MPGREFVEASGGPSSGAVGTGPLGGSGWPWVGDWGWGQGGWKRARIGSRRHAPGPADPECDSVVNRCGWARAVASGGGAGLVAAIEEVGWREDLDHPHPAAVAEGTATDVDAGEAQHHGLDRFAGRLGGRRRLAEQAPAAFEFGLACAVGKEAGVMDAHEAVGHDVQQEAADELVGLEVHDLGAVVMRAI